MMSNTLSFSGKFNSILFFEDNGSKFIEHYDMIKRSFNYSQIVSSLLDLDTFEMEDFILGNSFNDDNRIRKVIFHGEGEDIIIEYYKCHYIVENIFHVKKEFTGFEVINDFTSQLDDFTLALGFELSLDIDSFSMSIRQLKEDNSLFPFMIVDKINGICHEKMYLLEGDKSILKELDFIGQYYALLKFI